MLPCRRHVRLLVLAELLAHAATDGAALVSPVCALGSDQCHHLGHAVPLQLRALGLCRQPRLRLCQPLAPQRRGMVLCAHALELLLCGQQPLRHLRGQALLVGQVPLHARQLGRALLELLLHVARAALVLLHVDEVLVERGCSGDGWGGQKGARGHIPVSARNCATRFSRCAARSSATPRASCSATLLLRA